MLEYTLSPYAPSLIFRWRADAAAAIDTRAAITRLPLLPWLRCYTPLWRIQAFCCHTHISYAAIFAAFDFSLCFFFTLFSFCRYCLLLAFAMLIAAATADAAMMPAHTRRCAVARRADMQRYAAFMPLFFIWPRHAYICCYARALRAFIISLYATMPC